MLGVTTPLLLLGAAAALTPGKPLRRIVAAEQPARTAAPGPIIAVAVGLGMAVFLAADRVSIAIAALLAAFTVFRAATDAHRRRQDRAVRDATATFLNQLVADLDAGARPAEALTHSGAELGPATPPVVGTTVTTAATQARRGISPAPTFQAAGGHAPDLATVGELWALTDRHGVKLSGLLGQIRDRLTARARHDDTTAASLNGPQATAVILLLLPVAGLVMGTAMGANPLGLLLSGGLGGVLLVVGTALACGGFLWSQRIIAGARS